MKFSLKILSIESKEKFSKVETSFSRIERTSNSIEKFHFGFNVASHFSVFSSIWPIFTEQNGSEVPAPWIEGFRTGLKCIETYHQCGLLRPWDFVLLLPLSSKLHSMKNFHEWVVFRHSQANHLLFLRKYWTFFWYNQFFPCDPQYSPA